MKNYIARQREWSLVTFGLGKRTVGITRHIEKECIEIRANPDDVMEWVDVIILAIDGAHRAGHSPEEITRALQEKQQINFRRVWPKPQAEDQPTEHIRK